MKWQVKRKSLNESDHAYAGYEEMGTNIRVYDVRVFIYRFLISRAMVIMHESLRMIFMMTLQCTDACTDGVLKYIDVVLIYL